METNERRECTGKKASGTFGSILETLGNTPAVTLGRLSDTGGTLIAKLESYNPAGSTKDRPARLIIEQAICDGVIRPGSTVIESSSGNMGIGLAQACCIHGIRLICIVDPRTPIVSRRLIEAYGAVVECIARPHPVTGDFLDARIDRVTELLQRNPSYVWLDQYTSACNPRAHELGTGAEIARLVERYEQASVFCAVSTGGTLLGIYRALSQLPNTQIVAVDSVGSAAFGGERGERCIPGFGSSRPSAFLAAERIPNLTVVRVSAVECIVGCRALARREGIVAGGSAGGVVFAAARATRDMGPTSVAVAVLPDRGERYLDTVFNDDWVREHFGEDAVARLTKGI
jgi:2,3-diaminopropionate biosynthesis protein SbnA